MWTAFIPKDHSGQSRHPFHRPCGRQGGWCSPRTTVGEPGVLWLQAPVVSGCHWPAGGSCPGGHVASPTLRRSKGRLNTEVGLRKGSICQSGGCPRVPLMLRSAPRRTLHPPSAQSRGPLFISKVSFDKHESGETLVNVATSRSPDYRVTTLTNPARLVVDIDGAQNASHQRAMRQTRRF